MAFVVGHQCIRNGEFARGTRIEYDAVTDELALCGPGELADGAVLDAEESAGREHDAISAAEADALDGEAAETDPVIGSGIDRDAIEATRDEGAGLADPVVDDADRLCDHHRAVAARVEHRDLADRKGLVVGALECAARGGPAAIVGVITERRDECARKLRLGRRRTEAERKQNADAGRSCNPVHRRSPSFWREPNLPGQCRANRLAASIDRLI